MARAGTPDYSQWEDLRKIIAFFKAAPFIEVENAHVRQLVLAENPGGAPHDRMAFALRQLQIETLPDTVDCLQATLNMSLFNYLPVTRDFGYASISGRSVSAPRRAPGERGGQSGSLYWTVAPGRPNFRAKMRNEIETPSRAPRARGHLITMPVLPLFGP